MHCRHCDPAAGPIQPAPCWCAPAPLQSAAAVTQAPESHLTGMAGGQSLDAIRRRVLVAAVAAVAFMPQAQMKDVWSPQSQLCGSAVTVVAPPPVLSAVPVHRQVFLPSAQPHVKVPMAVGSTNVEGCWFALLCVDAAGTTEASLVAPHWSFWSPILEKALLCVSSCMSGHLIVASPLCIGGFAAIVAGGGVARSFTVVALSLATVVVAWVADGAGAGVRCGAGLWQEHEKVNMSRHMQFMGSAPAPAAAVGAVVVVVVVVVDAAGGARVGCGCGPLGLWHARQA